MKTKIMTQRVKIYKENCGHPEQRQFLYRCYGRKNGHLMTVAYVSGVIISDVYVKVVGIRLHGYVTVPEVVEALILDVVSTYKDTDAEYVAIDDYIYDSIPILERLGFYAHVYDDEKRILALADLHLNERKKLYGTSITD